jgi:hypothetical protein
MRRTWHQSAPAWALTAVLVAIPPAGAVGDEPRALTAAEFEKLHRGLQPPRGEAWRAVPWELTLLAARERAAREKKPVFLLVRSGHPLGCV